MSKKAMNKDIEAAIRALSEKYPNEDIIELISESHGTHKSSSTRNIDEVKAKVLASFHTDKEIGFNAIESGIHKAALADGRAALKEIIEKVPVEAPKCEDGTPMFLKGSEKKTS